MAENNTHQEVDDEMEVVTMVDVLKEEQELEEDTKAVLGGSDAQTCSYNQGYVKRQALYACITCIPPQPDSNSDLSGLAGVCLACSYKCHEGHTLIELYTKRNFRCDCGNEKFGTQKCTLVSEKDSCNENNLYNQNFMGLYCVCKRPYPDPEDTINDEMIQCALCEDWYHFRHLKCKDPTAPENFSEMICQLCMEKCDFLKLYSSLMCGYSKEDASLEVDVENLDEKTESTDSSTATKGKCSKPNGKITETYASFMLPDWRQQLCKCDQCLEMYEKHNVGFVTDLEDMVQFYEEKGKSSTMATQYEAGLEALSSLDRVKQVEAIAEYNDMKNHLKEYLQKFAENKKIVREEDIKEFFSTMAARKKQRVEVPTFCR